MSTVAGLIERTYRDWLYPPSERPIVVPLTTTITAAQTTFVYDAGYLAPEEEDLIDAGVIVEIDRELMLTLRINTGTRTVTVGKRGYLGTTAAVHTAAADITVAPTYPRQALLDAMGDVVEGWFPDLYGKVTQALTSHSSPVEVPAAVEDVLRYLYEITDLTEVASTTWVEGNVKLLRDFPGSGGTPATEVSIEFVGVPDGKSGYLTYKRRFARPTVEASDLLTTYLIPTRWERLLMVGMVAQVISGRDIDSATSEFIQEALESQQFPVGSGRSIFQTLLSYYQYLMDLARRDMQVYDDIGVEMMEVVLT